VAKLTTRRGRLDEDIAFVIGVSLLYLAIVAMGPLRWHRAKTMAHQGLQVDRGGPAAEPPGERRS